MNVNDRRLARVMLLRTLGAAEFLVVLLVTAALAAAAGSAGANPGVAADPVSSRLIAIVPTIIFAILVIASPLVLVNLATADRTTGWTAPLFAGGLSAERYMLALTLSVGAAASAVFIASSLAFHMLDESLGLSALNQITTGTLSLLVLCAYAAVLWLFMYDSVQTLLAMVFVWIAPFAVGVYLMVTKGFEHPPLWLKILLLLVPPVRHAPTFAPALIQAAYIALLAAIMVAFAPRRLPLWQ